MKTEPLQLLARSFAVATLVLCLTTFTACDDDDDDDAEVEISKISLNLDFNFTATGDLLLTLREVANSAVVGNSSVTIEGFEDANDGWIDFEFSGDVDIKKGKTYQIEVKRSNPNVPLEDVVLWRGATGDVYPHGESRVEGSSNPADGDFAFKIFVDGVVDQQQELTTEISLMSDDYTHIQEFMVGH